MWMPWEGPEWPDPPRTAVHFSGLFFQGVPLYYDDPLPSWREIHPGWTREEYAEAMDAFLAPEPPPPGTTINRVTNPWWTNKGVDMNHERQAVDVAAKEAAAPRPRLSPIEEAHVRLEALKLAESVTGEGDDVTGVAEKFVNFILGKDQPIFILESLKAKLAESNRSVVALKAENVRLCGLVTERERSIERLHERVDEFHRQTPRRAALAALTEAATLYYRTLAYPASVAVLNEAIAYAQEVAKDANPVHLQEQRRN